MTRRHVAMTVNGRAVEAEVEPRTHLADFLRETRLLTGTHLGCEQGVCGACTLLVDGRPTRACVTYAAACDAADIRTIEGFDDDPLMARLRDAFHRRHALQCGFCTPGMLATAYDVVRRLPDADAPRIRRELSGNLCRCTGYAGVVAAIEDVLADDPPAAAIQPAPRQAPRARAEGAPARTDAAPEAAGGAGLVPPEAVADGARLSRSLELAAPAEAVWRVLEDVPTVASCIPGAELSGPMEGDCARGAIAVAMGPIRARFDGVARLRLDPTARTGAALGRGRDRLSRSSVDGALDFAVEPLGDAAARLRLDMRYRLRGPLAQFGRPEIVAEIADRLLADTADAVTERALGRAPAAPPRALGGVRLLALALKGVVKRLLRRA